MKSGMVWRLGVAVLVLAGMGVWAQPPAQIDYQGKILVSDIPLTGDGYFKYAISDEAATTNYWSQDGTVVGEPPTWLTNDCYNGVFSTALGAAPMVAIDPAIFAVDTALVLRVWFSSDEVTFDEMLPAQRLLSAPYAINADTLDGYDAIDLLGGSITETDPVFTASAAFGVTTGGIADWNTAYGWGDHALAGYLASETDPVFTASDAFGITTAAIANWNTAYSWGDHTLAGYAWQSDFSDYGAVTMIDSSMMSDWDQAYSWGDHSSEGYLTQFDFTDFSAVSGIDSSSVGWWDDAYNWGDHSMVGYLTSESDPVWTAASASYYQKTEADTRYVNVTGDTMTGALLIDDAVSGTLKLDSSWPDIALGAGASAAGGTERIAIGHNVTNDVDNSARLRGELYMDGGMAVFGRQTFASGAFEQLLPLPALDNVVYVATNGAPAGPGTVDRPFDQPQLAYDYAAAHYTNVPATVVIAAGQYLPLNMNAGNIHVIGESRAQLDSLTISAAAHSILGKQRVENLVVTSQAIVMPDQGQDVKFHNCRLEGGLSIFGSNVEVQDCFVSGMEGAAVTVGNGITLISGIALTQSSFLSASPGQGTLLVDQNVDGLEVIGCKIFNLAPYAAIEDLQPATMGLMTPHLYSHNVIRGAETGTSPIPAVFDPNATLGPTMVFVHNAVWGDVGVTSNQQFYANNVVYGQINNTGGAVGWSQAGVGAGIDSAGNTEHQFVYPQPGGVGFPWAWQD